jgi:lysozyme family protein
VKDNFAECLKHALVHEGGFVNHPSDPGGMTNLGVTKAVWEDWIGATVTEQDMRRLTAENVTPLYRSRYWDAVKADDLPLGVDYCVFDAAINSGTRRSARWLQTVVGVTADGSIGPRTLAAVNAFDQKQLIETYCKNRLAFMQRLPTWETFGRGWSRRVSEVEKTALSMLQQ